MLYLNPAAAQTQRELARDYPSWSLSATQLGQLELLLSGALQPLDGYLSAADCARVQTEQCIGDGRLWPLPLTLSVSTELAAQLSIGKQLALRDPEGVLLAILTLNELCPDGDHVNLAGPVVGIEPPTHHAFTQLRFPPTCPPTDQPLLGLPLTGPISQADLNHGRTVAAQLQARLLLVDGDATAAIDDRQFYARVRWQQQLVGNNTEQSLLLLPLSAAIDPNSPDLANQHQQRQLQLLTVLYPLELDRRVKRAASQDEVCMRMMTVPGVGPIAALTFKAAVDDPSRFKRSRTVAAHFGLTPRRYQSGEHDNPGRISKAGDQNVRATLYAAANALLMRTMAGSQIKSWGMRLMRTKGRRRAVVAVARKLAVLLHRMWIDGTAFRQEQVGGQA